LKVTTQENKVRVQAEIVCEIVSEEIFRSPHVAVRKALESFEGVYEDKEVELVVVYAEFCCAERGSDEAFMV
jgi:hypothetical protein